jgi:hypothetical protein
MTDKIKHVLNRRMAELESVQVLQINGKLVIETANGYVDYNPAEDDAQIHRLMMKYKVDVVHHNSMIELKIYDDPEDNPVSTVSYWRDESTIHVPALMCIIGYLTGEIV